MKTRTLLLLSVGTALLILLAGGALLVQLSSQPGTTAPIPFGQRASVGDVDVTVLGVDERDGLLRVSVEVGGVDDIDGIDSFRLVTGDTRLTAVRAARAGRCTQLTTAVQGCTIDFDVSASVGSSRVLVVRRGEEQATWRLS